MNIAQAKTIPLVELLASKGFSPHSRKGNDVWYFSPFRTEKTPSFKVNLPKNVWYDYGIGEGGDPINLIQIMFSEPNISNALSMLDNFSSFSSKPVVSIPVYTQPVQETIIHSVREIENFALEKFLKTRGIALDRAKRYLSEIHYQRGKSSFFALAHPNETGGFEVKNSLFSGSVNEKGLSFIPGTGAFHSEKVAVFEGMFDFLALLELHNLHEPPSDILILNSLSLVKRSAELIKEKHYHKASLYFDNDKAGREAVEKFTKLFEAEPLSITDRSNSYAPYKDINDYLLEKRKKQISLDIKVSEQDRFIR